MTRETETPPIASDDPALDRAKSDTIGLRTSKKHFLTAAAGLMIALATAIPALVSTCQMRAQVDHTAAKVDQAAVQTRQTAVAANAAEDAAAANAAALRELNERHREQLKVMRSTIVELAKNCGMSNREVRRLQQKILSAHEDEDTNTAAPTAQEEP
jgi:uncharacterized membrane protein YhiD involved in acid resistance